MNDGSVDSSLKEMSSTPEVGRGGTVVTRQSPLIHGVPLSVGKRKGSTEEVNRKEGRDGVRGHWRESLGDSEVPLKIDVTLTEEGKQVIVWVHRVEFFVCLSFEG